MINIPTLLKGNYPPRFLLLRNYYVLYIFVFLQLRLLMKFIKIYSHNLKMETENLLCNKLILSL